MASNPMTSARPTADTLPKEPMARLLAVMAWLRDRQHGCPWDIDQTFRTIAPYTIEEAYEVADAIERDDMPALKEELGDLLLQVVYHAQMASEAKAFGFADVAAAIAARHQSTGSIAAAVKQLRDDVAGQRFGDYPGLA